jgi:hypothetical protein
MKVTYNRLRRNWPLLVVSLPVVFGLMKIFERTLGEPVTMGDFLKIAMLTGSSGGLAIAVLCIIWRQLKRN